ncbi:hypothetical protein Cni_G22631 [Canna indica]|uniref:Uncharacterized protein n=1 Tax=Canna indica TaxID=4628 RepID=A0AAQ3QIG2_9LILI|nr:hypothetical protein Cni_G22631 [Canna indica]
MKKLLLLMIPCLMLLASYLSLLHSQSSAVEDQDLGMRLRKKLIFSEMETAGTRKSEITQDQSKTKGSNGEEERLIYNADYRGVTTHPSPLPKHP